MKTFEISSKKNKNGSRHFKLILHQIYDDSTFNEETQTGDEYNKNGLSWYKRHCEKALSTIQGMSLRVAFIDDERTLISNHGETGVCDGEPTFEDATVIGTFTKGYIDDVETENGIISACIGEGEIDAMCYHNFVSKLEEDAENGIYPSCSVEIMRTDDNDSIIYEYGYKEKGRVPEVYKYSGCALLSHSCPPADDTAKLLELNNKEENNNMTEAEIKALVEQVVAQVLDCEAEMNKCKTEKNTEVAEAKAATDAVVAEKEELIASSQAIQTALDEAKTELGKKYEELDTLYSELEELRKALGEAKAKERIGEMNAAIAGFSEEEREYAKAEMDAFMEKPVESEINSVVDKIYEGIGKKAKEAADAAIVAEQNSAKFSGIEDIFSAVETTVNTVEDTNIF